MLRAVNCVHFGSLKGPLTDVNTVTNFIQRPLPDGSTTGSVGDSDAVPGALGMGQQASYGLGQCE